LNCYHTQQTIVCGGGQLSIEVKEVPKRLNDENVHATRRVPEGEKGLLLSSNANKVHSTS